MKYKGILLDLDDTVYDYKTPHHIALDCVLSQISDDLQLDLDTIKTEYETCKKLNHKQLPFVAASHNRLLYFQKMMERLNHFDVKYVHSIDQKYWEVFYKNIRLEPNFLSFIENVNIPVCIVTDFTVEAQYKKLIQLGIADNIKFLVTSEEAGVEKPHPFIFMQAINKLGFCASDCIMVGDSYKKDIIGAIEMGMDAIYYKGKSENIHITDCQNKVFYLNDFSEILTFFMEGC